MLKRGWLITFEGIDGSGKTTVSRMIIAELIHFGLDVLLLREPGGTAIGDEIRSVLHNTTDTKIFPMTELFLFLAARHQIVKEKICPALAEGKIVLLDRFTDSTIAYQGVGRDLGIDRVIALNNMVTDFLKPDLTLLFDLPVEESLSRIGRRGDIGRMDTLEREFYEKAKATYLKLARDDSKRWRIIDANEPVEQVAWLTLVEIKKKLTEARFVEGNTPDRERC